MKAISEVEGHVLTGMHIKEGIVSLVFGETFLVLLRPYDENEYDEVVLTIFEKDQSICSVLTSGEVVEENT